MKKQGFTIVELLFAMSFISILLLAIALTIVQVGTIYNQGMIAKDMNQSGRDIAAEFKKAMTASGSFSTDPDEHHYVTIGSGSTTVGGRLCIGNYSYIWNTAYGLSTTSPVSTRNKYTPASASATNLGLNKMAIGSTNQNEISLVKIPDSGSYYCTLTGSPAAYPAVDGTKATELLRNGDHSLTVNYLKVEDASSTTTDALSGQQLYKMVLVLGTPDSTAIKNSGTATALCKNPGESGADTDYCNVKNFTIVLRVASGVN